MSTSQDIYISNTPLSEALQRWQQALEESGNATPLPGESVAVDNALARITAEPVYAPESSPFYNAAAMDGIAVRHQDTAGAGEGRPIVLEASQYQAVNTGNVIPESFDAVVMIEDVQRLEGGRVELIQAATPWQHIRTIGEDIVATELLVPAGYCLRPVDQGALLAAGCVEIMVRPQPTVAIIPTGSEVVQPGSAVQPGTIREFNSRILAGYLTEWGCTAERCAIVPDHPEELEAAIVEAVAQHDLVLVNAGASAGSRDYTAAILARLGRVVVHGVNIKPGKPVILAIVDGTPVVGLPGYPISAVLCLQTFVRPLIANWLGIALEPPSCTAILARPVASRMGVEEFVRVKLGRVGHQLLAAPSGRGAGAIRSLAQADGIFTITAGSEGVGAGEEVTVSLLREPEEIDRTLVFIGSHDNVLDILADMLYAHRPRLRLTSAHVGSMGGIMALRRGEAHVAGSHLLDLESGQYNVPFIKKYLADLPLVLINLVWRQQGLLVRPGNPLAIKDFNDLLRPEVRYINRQRGAGTRLLCDLHLTRLGIDPLAVNGYDREEYTHMNVAAAVQNGTADCGLGILAAARALGLDFLPVARERYDLLIPKAMLEESKIVRLLELLHHSESFKRRVEALGGYDLTDCGKVLYEQDR